MLDLFKAELHRFRLGALLAFLLHGGLIAFYGRLVDLLQQPPAVVQAVAAVYALAGLLLGLFQMGGYRRANRWLNLIHRPLDPRRIALALIGAAAVMILVAIVLPMLLMLGVQQAFSARVVDLRHWLLPLAALLVAFAAYLAGAYAILGVRRYAPLILILPVLLAFNHAVGIGAIAVQALVVLWLAYLVMTAFRPDLARTPARPLAFAATVAPVVMALYLVLLTAGGIVFQLGWIMVGTHPLNSTPPAGGFVEASRAEGADLLAAALSSRRDPQARLWREQVRISDSFTVRPGFERLPVRGEMTNTVPIEFDDAESGVHWTFSHDSMRFEGRRADGSGAVPAALGLGQDQAPFQRPPISLGEGVMVDAGSIDRFDPEVERILPRIAVPAGETIAAAPVPIGESLAVLTDKALYFYDAQVMVAGTDPSPARQRVPLAGAIGNLERIDLVELLDGYLLSETFGRGSPDGEADPWQQLVRVDGAGHVEPVARRLLLSDFPVLTRFSGRWFSPLLDQAYRGAVSLFAPSSPLEARAPSPVPLMIWGLAACLGLAALLGAFWWSGRAGLASWRRVAWLLIAALAGLPALLALILFHPRRAAAA